MIRKLEQVQWAEIPGYNGLYLLSEFGNIFNTKTGRFLVIKKPKVTGLFVQLSFNGNVAQVSVNKLINKIYGSIRTKTY